MRYCQKINKKAIPALCYHVRALQVLNACLWYTRHSAYWAWLLNKNRHALRQRVSHCVLWTPIRGSSVSQLHFFRSSVSQRHRDQPGLDPITAGSLTPPSRVISFHLLPPNPSRPNCISLSPSSMWAPVPVLLPAGSEGLTSLPALPYGAFLATTTPRGVPSLAGCAFEPPTHLSTLFSSPTTPSLS